MDAAQFVTWEDLGTIGGAACAVSLIARFIKGFLPWFKGRRTLALVWVVSFLICLGVQSSKGGINWGLAIINSVLVAATAVGLREGQRALTGIDGKNDGPVPQPPAAPPPGGGEGGEETTMAPPVSEPGRGGGDPGA